MAEEPADSFERPFPALTAEQRLHLEVYGYVVVPGTLTADECARILAALQGLRRDLLAARERTGDAQARVRGAILLKDEPHHHFMGAVVEADPTLTGYASHPRLVGMAEELMGCEARMVEVNAHLNRRNPDADYSTPPTYGFHRGVDIAFGSHQDGGLYHCNFVKTLTNLTELGPDDGGTVVVAGSHKVAQPQEQVIECAYRDRSLIHQVVAPAGSTLLFSETLLHATGQVRSDRERAIVICGYAPTMYQSWDDGPLSAEFAAAVPASYRRLFLGRAHWDRGARSRSLADPVQAGSYSLPEWPQRLMQPASPTQPAQLARQILGASPKQLATLQAARDAGLMELEPVVLPVAPRGDNNHMGWPVATQVDDVLVVIHRRIPGHNPQGSGRGDADSTFAMATRSTDQGRTWSESIDLRTAMASEHRNRGGDLPLSHRYKFGPLNHSTAGYKLHMNAIGTTGDGVVVLLCNYGVFLSADAGVTWEHQPDPFRDDLTPGDIVYLGPRVIDHPRHGLLAFGNTVGYAPAGSPGAKYSQNPVNAPADHRHALLVVVRSGDGGRTWERIDHPLPDWAAQHEPAALLHDDQLWVIGRDQITGTDHVQMRFRDLGDAVDTRRTNMRNNRNIDTVDLDFNPVTGRLEVVRSRREKARLDLWSIDPAAWDSAEWRLETTLFSRAGGTFYRDADGFHPAGAVIDARRGVQHIFIYTGHPHGPAGSFRLTRTLDTPRLVELLSSRSN